MALPTASRASSPRSVLEDFAVESYRWKIVMGLQKRYEPQDAGAMQRVRDDAMGNVLFNPQHREDGPKPKAGLPPIS